MTRVAVDLDRLAFLVDRMAAIERQLDRLRGDVDATAGALRTRWRGRAAAQQALAEQRWRRGAAETTQALAELRAIVATAHANYSAALLANQRMWRR